VVRKEDRKQLEGGGEGSEEKGRGRRGGGRKVEMRARRANLQFSGQRWLINVILEIFSGNFQIFEDYKHPELIFRNSKRRMELDVFIPELNLAFEYQGHQHYIQRSAFG
jgi:hypothetical protein